MHEQCSLNIGQSTSPLHFTIVSHGKEYAKQSSIEFAADMTFSSLQQFGDKFIEQRVHSYQMPLDILQRVIFPNSVFKIILKINFKHFALCSR